MGPGPTGLLGLVADMSDEAFQAEVFQCEAAQGVDPTTIIMFGECLERDTPGLISPSEGRVSAHVNGGRVSPLWLTSRLSSPK